MNSMEEFEEESIRTRQIGQILNGGETFVSEVVFVMSVWQLHQLQIMMNSELIEVEIF